MSGAVSMKMSNSTSVTSTSGMMLISAIVPPIRRPLPLSNESTLMAMNRARPQDTRAGFCTGREKALSRSSVNPSISDAQYFTRLTKKL